MMRIPAFAAIGVIASIGGASALQVVATVLALLVPIPAQAFSQCTVTPLAGPGATIAEEGSNPVAWANWVYAGYTFGSTVGIVNSSDRGDSLGAPVTVFSGSGSVKEQRLGVSHKNLFAVWTLRTSSGWNLMFDASHNHGASWDAPIDFGPYAGSLSQIATDRSTVHVAYIQSDGTVAVRNSTDMGRSFSAPVAIGAGWGEVVIAAVGQNVYVAWNITALPRYDVMTAASHDGGATFSARNLSSARPSSAREPIFALDKLSGRLSLVWREDSPQQGIYLQSLDGAQTWSAPLVIDTPARQFMVVDDGTYIYASYLKKFLIDGVTDWQVYLAMSRDGGASFPSIRNLSGPTGISSIDDDDARPMPWILDGDGAFRLTGIEADGVHAWDGRDGHILTPIYVGPGDTASPAFNSMVWMAPNKVVTYAVCH